MRRGAVALLRGGDRKWRYLEEKGIGPGGRCEEGEELAAVEKRLGTAKGVA